MLLAVRLVVWLLTLSVPVLLLTVSLFVLQGAASSLLTARGGIFGSKCAKLDVSEAMADHQLQSHCSHSSQSESLYPGLQ